MGEQSVVIGEIVIDGGSPITVRAEVPEDCSRARIAFLKYKLAYLLDTRFHAADPEPRPEMTIDEVTALWHCHRVSVLRRIAKGELHPLERHGDMRFKRAEVERLYAVRRDE
jgi:hypothetical protein